MRKGIVFLMIMAVSVYFSYGATSFAYETVEVKNGGSIEGVVEFTGATVPKDPMLKLSSETKYCGTSLPAEKYVIKDKKIANVAVYITEIKSGKAIPAEPLTITNIKCLFSPHVAIGYKGGKLTQKNDDPIFHNIHTYLNGKTMFNIGLPEKGSSVTKPLLRDGLMEVTCDSHPWMHGFIVILDHPYGAVTNESGAFIIKDVPAGTYAVEAWHEALGKVKVADVKVESGKATKIKIDYKK
ncbi:MAG TPA: carboxypeptidase regulatory-like domain-containing protein [Nitrospirota bacterium]|nr:carboxypeptidase regulatory-like domain-containing protein [Nitrospirota bacterium]